MSALMKMFVGEKSEAKAVEVNPLEQRVTELEHDLVRLAEILASGNMDGKKFKEIATKRQG